MVGDDNVLDKFEPEKIETLFDRQAALREDNVDNPGLLILGAVNLHSNGIGRATLPRKHMVGDPASV